MWRVLVDECVVKRGRRQELLVPNRNYLMRCDFSAAVDSGYVK